MSFKQLIFQCTLTLFIIGLSSCKKQTDFVLIQNKVVEHTNTTDKFGERNKIEFVFYLDGEISIEKTLSTLKKILHPNELAFHFSNNINSKKQTSHQFIFNLDNDHFEELNTKTNRIESLDTPTINHLITVENTHWDINIYQNARIDNRAVTIVDVSTKCRKGDCIKNFQ